MTTINTYAVPVLAHIARQTADGVKPAYHGPTVAECIGGRSADGTWTDGCHRVLPMTKFPTSAKTAGIVRRLTECRKCRDARTGAGRDARMTTGVQSATSPVRDGVVTAPANVGGIDGTWALTVNRFARIINTTDNNVRLAVERASRTPYGVWHSMVTNVRPDGVPVIPMGTPVPSTPQTVGV